MPPAGTTAIAERVAEGQAQWGDPATERLVFGTGEPRSIATLVDTWCGTNLGTPVGRCHFVNVSTGCVFGLRLVDGREVVVKGYQPRFGAPFLHAVQHCQTTLVEAGVPCPRPVAPPRPIGAGLATAEGMVDDLGPAPAGANTARASARRASTSGLARIVGTLHAEVGHDATAALAPHPLDARVDGLYPEPHSPLFDFGLDPDGAAWIDALATRAAEARAAAPGPIVIGHTDWAARNVRLGPDPDRPERVIMTFDWDALARTSECVVVGQAARIWCTTGEAGFPYPTASEVAAFVHDYETERGTPFSATQRRAVAGSALWLLSYSARCEHALASRWPDHDHPTVARDQLATERDLLLTAASPLA